MLVLPLSVATQTACGEKRLSQAAEAAKDIGGGTRDVISAVDQAFTEKLITLEQKDKLADLLGLIAKGGQKGVDAIELLQQQGVENPTPEQSKLLMRIFDDNVIAPFLQLLTELGKLSDTSSAAIRAAMISVRAAILLLSNRIGRNDVIRRIEVQEAVNA
jgi:3-oxoacyl-(acyl-carrier-protein) synthase